MKKIFTLCLIHQHPQILLGFKKKGLGAGNWNGFGGKVEPNEDIEAAARRELQEEAGIDVEVMTKTGTLLFEFQNNPEVLEVHIFRADNFSGQPTESDEMIPQWFHIDNIPYDRMWSDDRHWLPLFLKGKKFQGRFLFDDSNTILEKELVELQGFS